MNQNHPICSPLFSRILACLMAVGVVALDLQSRTLLTARFFMPDVPLEISSWFSLLLGTPHAAVVSSQSLGVGIAQTAGMIVLSLLLTVWLFTTQDRRKIGAIGLVLGGVLGNLIEQLSEGATTPLFNIHLGAFLRFSFNAGDAFIVVGVLILILGNLVPHPRSRARIEEAIEPFPSSL